MRVRVSYFWRPRPGGSSLKDAQSHPEVWQEAQRPEICISRDLNSKTNNFLHALYRSCETVESPREVAPLIPTTAADIGCLESMVPCGSSGGLILQCIQGHEAQDLAMCSDIDSGFGAWEFWEGGTGETGDSTMQMSTSAAWASVRTIFHAGLSAVPCNMHNSAANNYIECIASQTWMLCIEKPVLVLCL